MNNPNPTMPKVGYCRKRTRQRARLLIWAVLLLFVSAALLVFFWHEFSYDSPEEESNYYLYLIFSGVLSVGTLIGGLYCAFAGIRDAFFPEKSALAKSIRSQLPYPDEAPPVDELFAMVDKDIAENGIWIDRIAVGHEWVFGDSVSLLSRIRLVFGRDEIQHHRSGKTTTTTRIIQVYIMDDRRQVQISDLKNPKELPMLLDCLRLRAPDALIRPYAEYTNYLTMKDDEWDTLERDYRRRKAEREAKSDRAKVMEEQNMILTLPDGSATSRVTEELVRKVLADALTEEEAVFTLTPSRPVVSGGRRYFLLQCVIYGYYDEAADEEEEIAENEILLMLALAPDTAGQPPKEGLICRCNAERAKAVLLEWLRGNAPDTSDWEPTEIRTYSRPEKRDTKSHQQLVLFAASGAAQSHDRFTREDVEVAAEGIIDGSYRQVDLTLPGGYLWIRLVAGDKMDGRCTVTATKPDGTILRYFTAKASPRKAAEWLMGYSDGKFLPGGEDEDWKDVTKQMTKK